LHGLDRRKPRNVELKLKFRASIAVGEMTRATLLLGALAALAAPAAASASCPAPKHLAFSRKAGASAGHLSWRPARRAPRGIRYSVARDRDVIGRTARSHMRVRVHPRRTYWFFVRPLTETGRPMLCWSQLRYRVL
jgi:hypothetical protein